MFLIASVILFAKSFVSLIMFTVKITGDTNEYLVDICLFCCILLTLLILVVLCAYN